MVVTHPDPDPAAGVAAAPDSGPTVLRILLGAQLRRLRESKGVTREQAGWEIRASESKLSRMENGRVGFKERDIADLLSLYGVTDRAERESLLDLALRANNPGWWHRYSDVHPKWFEAYLGLEAAASVIRTYEVQFVPGLLQTSEYAEAVIRLAYGGADHGEIERRVALRTGRQRMLYRADPPPPHLWAVVDEAALRRPIGGPEVMCGELEFLIEVGRRPNITIQVLPFHAGGHAAAGGAFSLLRFPEPDLPDVVYMEQLTGALYIDERRDVDTYVEAMERLCLEAASPEASLELLGRLRRELRR